MAKQQRQQLELGAGQGYGSAVSVNPAGEQVRLDPLGAQRRRGGLRVGTQLRAHARDKLGHREGLDQVVDCAGVESRDAILDLAASGQARSRARSISRPAQRQGSPARCGPGASGRARSRRSSRSAPAAHPRPHRRRPPPRSRSACRPRRTKSTMPGSSSTSSTRAAAEPSAAAPPARAASSVVPISSRIGVVTCPSFRCGRIT